MLGTPLPASASRPSVHASVPSPVQAVPLGTSSLLLFTLPTAADSLSAASQGPQHWLRPPWPSYSLSCTIFPNGLSSTVFVKGGSHRYGSPRLNPTAATKCAGLHRTALCDKLFHGDKILLIQPVPSFKEERVYTAVQ